AHYLLLLILWNVHDAYYLHCALCPYIVRFCMTPLRRDSFSYRTSALASTASAPPVSCAHSFTVRPSSSGRPHMTKGAVSKSARIARTENVTTFAFGSSRRSKSARRVARSGPWTTNPG